MIAADVHVYALAPDYDETSRASVQALGAEPVEISMDRTGMHPIRDLADAARLVSLLKRLRPDATLSYTIKPVIYGSIAAKLAGVPRRFALITGLGYIYIREGGDETRRRRLLRSIASGLYRFGLRACDRVFFQNQDDADEFSDAGLFDSRKAILLSGTGVDLDRLVPAPPVRQPPTFVFVGRLLREKGINEYVLAAGLVRELHPQARFLVVGDLDSNPGSITRKEVEDWAEQGMIEWLGHVEDVRPYLAQSSVFVLPSWREGKPRSTQEAMAMARPVISTDVPGCRETVDQGVNGILVPVRDPAALAAAMRQFIDDPDMIERMGNHSRRLAEECFDVHKINRQMLTEMGIEASS